MVAALKPTRSNARIRRKLLRIPGMIARDLGVQIVSGRFKPGEILHGEIETSGRLQVSRAAYREAVRILAAKGLVKAFPKVGTRVTPQAQWHLLDPDVLGWIFEFDPDETLLANLFELRRMVEPEAAALAAARRTPEDLAAMAAALKGMSRYTLNSKAGREADQEFHAALLRSTGNAFVESLTAGVGAAITWTTIYKGMHSPRLRDSVPDHQKVYEAVAAQDQAAAREAMGNLVELALRDTTDARRMSKRGQSK
ncbi:MAG TPA: FCD domain-containing protein [Steroidobacteraceae bacterium]|jgi:DNA-binding FadR family transcriptional regulator